MTAIETVTLVLAAVALAGLIAPRLGIAAALVELCLGIVLGNIAHIDSKTPWLVLFAGFGGMAVTFLAGTEIDAHALRRRPGPALLLGGTAFAAPFVVSGTVAWVVLGWSPAASVIAATALSETSLAITYAVLIDLRLIESSIGRLVMAAVFVTDLTAVLVLSCVSDPPSVASLVFVAGSTLIVLVFPPLLARVYEHWPNASSLPGLRMVILALVALQLLAAPANAVAVLPAFVLGVAAGVHVRRRPEEQSRLRTLTFAMFAPVFFVRAGMSVSLPAVASGGGIVLLLFAVKVLPKAGAAFAVTRRHFRESTPREVAPVVLLMSTGLTFGTVAALTGLQTQAIDAEQFSVLVAAIVASALLPAWAAQRLIARSPLAIS